MDNMLNDQDEVQADGKEYMKYKRQARDKYEYLMKGFEFRCRRAAMMNYYEADKHDKQICRMQKIAAFLGTTSISAVSTRFFPINSWLSSPSAESFRQMGVLGMVVGAGACVVYFLGKGSSRVIPSLSCRMEVHIAAAAAWQHLALTTQSFLVQLDDPKLTVQDYATWYKQLISEREELCKLTSIPQSTYNRFNDPRLVYDKMREGRQMFLQYLELEKMEPTTRPT